MDTECTILNFMEISNLPFDEAKRILENVGYNLELAIQNYYDQTQESTPYEPVQDRNYNPAPLPVESPDEVRPVIPREYDMLIQSETTRDIQLSAVRQQFSSSFRDLKREIEIQEELARGEQPKRKCLEMIYKHPVDIAYNFDFTHAKLRGQQLGKWVAVLINNESYESLSFNRDVFNDENLSEKVKKILKKNFIFLRKNCNDLEALKILQIYNLLDCQTIPIFLIIDSITGELRKNFNDCTKLTVRNVIRELKKYTSTKDNQLIYSSSVEDSDDDSHDVPASISHMRPSTSQQSTTLDQKSSNVTKTIESDEESFASLSEHDDDDDDVQEVKVLDSDDELLAHNDEPQTNVLLRLEDESHKFKYPASRSVGHLINYIYRNYLVKTGIYDNKTKRFALFSKIHNKCLTALDHDLTLKDANIHPSIVLLHNTLDKDE
ncbi:UBX domain-containing protein 7 [Chironomus tepperi]|uniref:UBX domain-containing protein 7 n=1 Tax=Chironomus tepperi TaxID=113505 RepID=UPI00391F06A2